MADAHAAVGLAAQLAGARAGARQRGAAAQPGQDCGQDGKHYLSFYWFFEQFNFGSSVFAQRPTLVFVWYGWLWYYVLWFFCPSSHFKYLQWTLDEWALSGAICPVSQTDEGYNI